MVSDIQLSPAQKSDLQKAKNILSRSKQLLFTIGVLGQFLFVAYIVAFYGGVAMSGDYAVVNEHLGHGVVEGDFMGNLALGVHIFLAAVVMFGGPLQFIKKVRTHYPKFHRWNGRLFYVIAFVASLAGLYMNITRGANGGIPGFMGNALNAALIMIFSVLAWRTALKRNFVAHRKWAIRAFLMVSGVWFFRVGYGLWILLSGFSGLGMSQQMDGPFDIFLMFGHSLVPLAIAELYFFAKADSRAQIKKGIAGIFGLLSLLLVAGILMVSLVFWLPMF